MHHSFHFSTSRFNATQVKDYFINDRCFGDDLIAWLRADLLRAMEHADIGNVIQEDYGWGFWVELGSDRCWVYAGLLEGQYPLNADAEWLAALEVRESAFLSHPGAHARRQDWFDRLVISLRAAIAGDPTVKLLGESDD